jgi:hypothetical protein
LVEDVVAGMEQPPQWNGGAPGDAGAFGKEVHRRVSQQLQGKQEWLTDVYVNNTTKEIVSIGNTPPGGVDGTTQIDVLRMKQGQTMQKGQVFDPNKVDDLFDVKTSISGTLSDQQKGRLRGLMGGRDIMVVGTKRRWTAASGWHDNKKLKNAATVWKAYGIATTAYAIIHSDSFDEELEALVARAKFIKERPYEQKGGDVAKFNDMVDWQNRAANYVKRFTPEEDIINLMQIGAIYQLLAELDTN